MRLESNCWRKIIFTCACASLVKVASARLNLSRKRGEITIPKPHRGGRRSVTSFTERWLPRGGFVVNFDLIYKTV